ncbi:MAG: epoxyqueuosine reductase [Clostridia bacterium]|nr:epoxyqueuosine reductase [Clostridia bacterium]
MEQTIKELLRARGITAVAPIALSHCTLTRPYLLERAGIADGTAFMLAVPYYTTECDDPARNISAYAVSRDYHLFFRTLFDELLPVLHARFPAQRFAGFADHSPIAEAEAAVKAGLGSFGCNHLFLTEEHSSFVFLGEIVTDAVLDAPPREVRTCEDCGACLRACPVGLAVHSCLSALTQKKGELSEDEAATVLKNGSAWGCDRCQEACPVTKRARARGTLYSEIPFFRESAIPHLTAARVREMNDAEFAMRAYSWRGREVILRNLEYFEQGGKA